MTPKELRSQRKQLHLTQTKLAQLMEVSNVTICRWEKEIVAITPQMGRLLSFIFSEEENKQKKTPQERG